MCADVLLLRVAFPLDMLYNALNLLVLRFRALVGVFIWVNRFNANMGKI